MKEHIAIIGGGIGGLSTAIALQKMGYSVTLYEKHHESVEIGSGINLGANAVVSLDYLGVGEKIREVGIEENSCLILSDKGKELTNLNYNGHSKANYTFLLRAELVRILSEALQPDTIVFKKRLKDFKQDKHQVTLYFEDGTSAKADYLIASDGIYSSVRNKLLPNKKLRFAGYSCWRGVAEKCPDYIERKFTETWGPKGRVGIIPLTNNRIYWYALKNCSEADDELKHWDINDIVYNFISYHTPIPNILERTDKSQLFFRKIYDLDPIYQYAFDRILLLGDAAHATTPNMGQGACQAIEDALYLALSLKNSQSIQLAFQDYEKQRLARTRKVVQDSWMLGKMAQIDIPLICSIRNKVIELAPNKIHHKKLKEIFDISSSVRS